MKPARRLLENDGVLGHSAAEHAFALAPEPRQIGRAYHLWLADLEKHPFPID